MSSNTTYVTNPDGSITITTVTTMEDGTVVYSEVTIKDGGVINVAGGNGP